MNVILEFLSQYGFIFAYTALTAIVGFIGTQIKKIYDRATADDTKREVVETCVKTVEQIYQELSGTEKLEKAKENIIETALRSHGFRVSRRAFLLLLDYLFS